MLFRSFHITNAVKTMAGLDKCSRIAEDHRNLANDIGTSRLHSCFKSRRSRLEPESDLHRHIRVENLRFGSNGAFLNFDFDLDGTYRPFVKLSSQATTPLYACSAGCLEPPKAISNVPVELVIKVTKPVTPILFIADTKAHLEQVKETLHVIEVIDAPPHEYEKIELHKHGENRGLPTIFWVILVLVIVAFHLFLFKLLYTEWKNSASIPYTKFNKKFLLRR
ncbi:protein C17H12.2 [Ditylenchus destructor]|nr:protein C17H12.2 [Ditylenchus destructor]